MFKAYVESYGCSSSLADKEAVLGLFEKEKFLIVESLTKSDINLIVTCTVKIPTVNRMLYRIRKLTETGKPLVVIGCLTKTRRRDIEKINPCASLVSPDWVESIVDVVYQTLKGKKVVLVDDVNKHKLGLPRKRTNPVVAIVQTGKGCLSDCSYCSEPYRMKLFSYPVGCVLKEVENAVREGCKEIWLSSLDNGCYGFDIGTNLGKLLSSISRIDGKFFVRVGMANPSHLLLFLDDLVEAYKSDKIFKFLHLPIQSASDKVLRLMNRKYTTKEFKKIVSEFRKEFPQLTLATDIIVGFPGESEKDFRKTLDFLKRIKPDIVNISKFGLHPNTRATSMEQLNKTTINRRTKKLFNLVKSVQYKTNKKWLGWEGEVLIDECGKIGTWIGRNFAYKPIVLRSNKNLLGKFVKVIVEDVKPNYLVGLILNKSSYKL